jgi:hypothetical protein
MSLCYMSDIYLSCSVYMDDVDNLTQVRKVAIVVVALFLVHMG